ncbi:MAG: hypothetical protein FD153_395, partial [Rhodospirillaceae bacterium]
MSAGTSHKLVRLASTPDAVID